MTPDELDPQSDPHAEARLDALLRDARRTYDRPPAPDVDALWTGVARTLPSAAGRRPGLALVPEDGRRPEAPGAGRPAWWPRRASWLSLAAVLLVGVAIGRLSVGGRAPAPAAGAPTAVAAIPTPERSAATDPAQDATNEYLGRTAALLAALPAELQARRANPAYLSRADALLLQTRLLLDSPAAADPALRSLFDDLEVVLAQVVRLHAGRDATRIDFLNEALAQRDVLPRLRDAVAESVAE